METLRIPPEISGKVRQPALSCTDCTSENAAGENYASLDLGNLRGFRAIKMSSSSGRGLGLSPGHWLAHGLGDAKPTYGGRFSGNRKRSRTVNRSMETAG